MSKTHKKSNTRLYRIWKSMRTRCNNSNRTEYKDYGGRGITICQEWDEFQNFYDWAMENGYKESLTIDRIDVNGNYEPSNCQWITRKEQNQNRRNTIHLTYNGISCTPVELSKILNISVNTIYSVNREKGLTDFTHYKHRHGVAKHITKRKDKYELTLNKKYIGRFDTLEDAIKTRDRILLES